MDHIWRGNARSAIYFSAPRLTNNCAWAQFMLVDMPMYRKAPSSILTLAFCGFMLAACNSGGFGYKKSPPNEFAIATKPPLVFPPDFNITPPRANARGPEALSTIQAAQFILGGKLNSTSNTASAAENNLLARAGIQDVHRTIREILENEARGVVPVRPNILAQFSKPPKNSNLELDGEAASQELENIPRSVPPEQITP